MAHFGQEPSLMLVVPSSIPKPCVGLIHVGREYQDEFTRFRQTIGAFNPFHGLGFLGLKDTAQQGPVDGPRLDGFGMVGLGAVHTLLADVDLPAAEIGRGWFHGLGV